MEDMVLVEASLEEIEEFDESLKDVERCDVNRCDVNRCDVNRCDVNRCDVNRC